MIRTIFIVLFFFSSTGFSQNDEIVYTETQKAKIRDASGSAFMQYSNFIPKNLDEFLVAISGNEKADSILLQSDSDTLVLSAADFFDISCLSLFFDC